MKHFRLSLLALLGFLGLAHAQDYTGKVGINTDTPAETLHINGTARIESLPVSGTANALYNSTANKNTTFTATRTVVADANGNLGVVEGVKASNILLDLTHTASGLYYNTQNGTALTANYNVGVQDYSAVFRIFGSYGEPASFATGTYTNTNTNFTANAGDVLNISTEITFQLLENRSDGITLNSLSANGDRQVVIYLQLYKGSTLKKTVKRVMNFNGRNGSVNHTYTKTENNVTTTYTKSYNTTYVEALSTNYKITETGSDYSVSVTTEAIAPKDGMFRMNYVFPQNVMVQRFH